MCDSLELLMTEQEQQEEEEEEQEYHILEVGIKTPMIFKSLCHHDNPPHHDCCISMSSMSCHHMTACFLESKPRAEAFTNNSRHSFPFIHPPHPPPLPHGKHDVVFENLKKVIVIVGNESDSFFMEPK